MFYNVIYPPKELQVPNFCSIDGTFFIDHNTYYYRVFSVLRYDINTKLYIS